MTITPAKYEWTIIYRMDEPASKRFTEEEYKTLCYLGDHGFLFTCSYPSNLLNFGVRLEGGQGSLPFTNPVGEDGMKEKCDNYGGTMTLVMIITFGFNGGGKWV